MKGHLILFWAKDKGCLASFHMLIGHLYSLKEIARSSDHFSVDLLLNSSLYVQISLYMLDTYFSLIRYMIIPYQISLIRYMINIYFLPFCGLSFHFPDGIFAHILNFDEVQLFFICNFWFWCHNLRNHGLIKVIMYN